MTVVNLSKNQADSVSSGIIRSPKGRKTFEADVSKEIDAMDGKMCLLMCGQQASGATFPCYYCTYRHGNKCEKEFKNAKFKPVLSTRTFRGLNTLAQAYQDPNVL